MARCRRLRWLSLLPLAALVGCDSESAFERRLRAAREQEALARQAAVAEFPSVQDLDELELDDLYSLEVATLLVDERALWICAADDLDVEQRPDGHYLVSSSGPGSGDDQYYLLLSASHDQVRQFLKKPREQRYSTSYLFVVRLRDVAKPRLQLDAEVFEYDEIGALSHVVFQSAKARVLYGDLIKAFEY